MASVDATEVEELKKSPPKFDLSDGIQKEDFIALGIGIWQFIKYIITIIFYPVIWVLREFERLRHLLSTKVSRPLTSDEIRFIRSWPIFLSTIGLTIGTILGIIAAITEDEKLDQKIQDLGKLFGWFSGLLEDLIRGLYNLLTSFLGFIWDLLVGFKDFVLNDIFKTQNIAIPFTVLAIIGFIGAIIVLLFLESRFVTIILEKLKNLLSSILNLPKKIYTYLDENIWNTLLIKVGQPFVGGKKIKEYDNIFYKKVILYTFLFSILTFIAGVWLFIQRDFSDNLDRLIFLIIVLLIAGVISGFPVTFGFVKMLGGIASQKYSLNLPKLEPTPKSKDDSTYVTPSNDDSAPSTSTTTIPSKPMKSLSAKERAMERRKRRKRSKTS